MLKLTAKRTKWFVLPQDESEECRLEILHLKPGEEAEIEEMANQVVGKSVDDKFLTEVTFKFSERKKAILDRVVLNWEGPFLDEAGEKMDCTLENKLLVANEFDWFFDQVEKFRKQLKKEVEEENEGAEGN